MNREKKEEEAGEEPIKYDTIEISKDEPISINVKYKGTVIDIVYLRQMLSDVYEYEYVRED